MRATCALARTVTSRADFQEGDRLRCTGGSLAVGASAAFELVHTLGTGSHAGDRWTSVAVDPGGTIREADETNNAATAT